MIIVGIFCEHDACAAVFDDYRMISAVAQERMSRIKGDGHGHPGAAVDECLAAANLSRSDVEVVAMTLGFYPARYFRSGQSDSVGDRSLLNEMRRARIRDPSAVFDWRRYLADHGFSAGTKCFFYNHHIAHVLGALFHTDWDSGIGYSFDGSGDRQFFSAYRIDGGRVVPVAGGEWLALSPFRLQPTHASVATLYLHVTRILGFKPLRHEGKVLGLAAFGKPRFANLMAKHFKVDLAGRVWAIGSINPLVRKIEKLARCEPREDIAASVQQATERVILKAADRLMRRAPSRRLAVAGGLFANVKLNQLLAEKLGLDEFFAYPAMSDQGQAAGGVLQYLLQRDGSETWLASRQKFETLYFGRDYESAIDRTLEAHGAAPIDGQDPALAAAQLIERGAAVATFLERAEYGPRALGARSIIASARRREINASLNKRLDRTDFMPFAPYVRAERANDLFDLPTSLTYAANFMTTTCAVRREWRERVPAIVHVDGTARPQIIYRRQNPIYYDVLHRYEELTGEAALINTSFNAHEEPIINTPAECARALVDSRVDAVLTPTAIWRMPNRTLAPSTA